MNRLSLQALPAPAMITRCAGGGARIGLFRVAESGTAPRSGALTPGRRRNIPLDQFIDAMHAAWARDHVPNFAKWKYACGIIWNQLRERQRLALEILASGEVD